VIRVLLLLCALLGVLPAAARGAGDPAAGKRLYGQFCVACHGAAGRGIGPADARPMGGGPLREQAGQLGMGPPLRGVGELAADFYLRTGYMPLPKIDEQPRRARVELNDAEIANLVAYVGSLGPGPPVPSPQPERGNLAEGLKLFTDHCAGCHQVGAAGGYVTGAVPPPLDQATPVQIAEAVRIGPYVMPRFSRKAISDRELDSIIAYVQYAKSPDDRGGLSLGHLGPVPEGLVAWLIAGTALVAVCVIIGRSLGGRHA
jgi:ubiquinol-cytochrome c reductase cytochrome c subunit